jgi:anti-anti-sigma factor
MEHMDFEQSPSRISDVSVVRLKGPFTLSTMFDLQATLREPAMKGLIIDLSGVSYIDSAALGVLLGQFAHTQHGGHKFALTGLSSRVHTIFEITGTNKVLPIFATVEEAENSF